MAPQLCPANPTDVGMLPDRLRAATRVAEDWIASGETSALCVLVARGGGIVLHAAYGRLTPAADAPPTPLDAIFPVASVTKPITATAVLCLLEDGRVGLNRPVREYLPEFAGDDKAWVTVRHLLTHTSGLRSEDVAARLAPAAGATATDAGGGERRAHLRAVGDGRHRLRGHRRHAAADRPTLPGGRLRARDRLRRLVRDARLRGDPLAGVGGLRYGA